VYLLPSVCASMTDAILNSQVQSPLCRELISVSGGITDTHKQFTHRQEEYIPPVSCTRDISGPTSSSRDSSGRNHFGDTMTFTVPRKGFWSQTVARIEFFYRNEDINIDTFHFPVFAATLMKSIVVRTASTILQTISSEGLFAELHMLQDDETRNWRNLLNGVFTTDYATVPTTGNRTSDELLAVFYLPLFLWMNDSVSTQINTERVEDIFIDITLEQANLVFKQAGNVDTLFQPHYDSETAYLETKLITHFQNYEQHVSDKIWEAQVPRGTAASFVGRTTTLKIIQDISPVNVVAKQYDFPIDCAGVVGDIYDILLVHAKDGEVPGSQESTPGQKFISVVNSLYDIEILEEDAIIYSAGSRLECSITNFKNPALKHEPEYTHHQHSIDVSAALAVDIPFPDTIMRIPFQMCAGSVMSGSINPTTLQSLRIRFKQVGAGNNALYIIFRQHKVFTIDGTTGRIYCQQHV
jgi:hypothetical protein